VSFLGDIFNIVTGLSGIFDKIDALEQDGAQLVSQIKGEVEAIKRFKHDPKWKTRVINVPKAYDKTKEFVVSVVDELHDALASLISNIKAIKGSGAPISDPRAGGGGGVGTVLGDITKVALFVQECDNAIKALSGFVDALRKIREELETFDDLFLGQTNKRKRVADAKPFLRLGKLHQLS